MKCALFGLLLLPAALLADDLTGVFARGERYAPPADHAPANMSRMYVRAVERSVDLPASGDSSMIIWTMNANAQLTTPSGSVLRPSEAGSLDRGVRRFQFDGADVEFAQGQQHVLHVMQSVAANYHLDVDKPGLVVVGEPDSRIQLATWASPLSRQPGEPVTLHAELRESDAAIAGASVIARVAGKPVELNDRGNGVYEAVVRDVNAAPGALQIRFDADGETASGVRFARSGSGEIVNERGAARLIADSIRTTREDGVLHVSAVADVAIAGTYRFDVIVARGDESLAWGEGVRKLTVGRTPLELAIPLEDAGALRLDVRLLGLDPMGVAGRAVADIQ